MRRLKNITGTSAGIGLPKLLRAPPPPRASSPDAAEREDALPFEEEVALLREEQAEARQVDLLLVLFDLREVGVVGDVGGQAFA